MALEQLRTLSKDFRNNPVTLNRGTYLKVLLSLRNDLCLIFVRVFEVLKNEI